MKNKELEKRMIRHGEVLLMPVDSIPEEAKETFSGKQHIVAHSETGHHHVAVADLGVFSFGDKTFLKVNHEGRIEHRKSFEKHETKILFKGLYQVVIKRSYNYFEKIIENVRD